MLTGTVIASNQIMGSKGYKYKNIIAPLVSGKKVGTRINKRVNLSTIYPTIYWDNPNEIVDRLRLLEAIALGESQWSRQGDSVKEFVCREAGLIIN